AALPGRAPSPHADAMALCPYSCPCGSSKALSAFARWAPRRLSPGAKRVEHHAAGPAGLRQAELGLILLDGLVRLGADRAVGRADIIAALRQESLDLLALGAREAAIVRRPGA